MHGKHHHQQQQMAPAAVAPKGCVTVRVGADGEEQCRFAVPLGHLKHPLFGALLEEAEREYGFRHQGAIAIPSTEPAAHARSTSSTLTARGYGVARPGGGAGL